MAPKKKVDNAVSLTLLGDFFLGEDAELDEASAISDFLRNQPLAILNFEGALGRGKARNKSVNLKMSKNAGDFLENSLVSLANNHILDFGQDGLRATLDSLSRFKVPWFGLESCYGAADNYEVFDVSGIRICIAGFGWRNEECVEATACDPGVVNFTQANIDRTLASLVEEKYDFLIVYVHFGYEFEYYPLPLHVGLCRYLANNGASLVFGSHAHCIQPYEIYNGTPIFYGLGNFYFSSRSRYPVVSDRGLAVRVSLDTVKSIVRVDQALQINYFRDRDGLEIKEYDEFLIKDTLGFSNLSVYNQKYKQIRHRKKNPRPVMFYGRDISNEIRYRAWLFAVRVTGWLGVRNLVKRVMGWN